jgi:hypothetical protein
MSNKWRAIALPLVDLDTLRAASHELAMLQQRSRLQNCFESPVFLQSPSWSSLTSSSGIRCPIRGVFRSVRFRI